ncbi:MAG: dTDP-4-dehydrorhamnose 3,5-epimerase [Ruminococcaceae bacterium]|nr:dTDP-4-dehydrorhamnose 3,5-epimerase [Oscillospiraceae bacterium]
MLKFKFIETGLKGMFVVETKKFGDNRGYFMETYNEREFKNAGYPLVFVQDNQSMSKKGVLRGLHFQRNNPQGKLVRVLSGEVFDVGVDIRRESETFGKWFGTVLSAENGKQIYVPEGFAHGFLVLSDTAEFAYKCTRFYDPHDEGGIIWNDPDISIIWPEIDGEIILSEKDKLNPLFKEAVL